MECECCKNEEVILLLPDLTDPKFIEVSGSVHTKQVTQNRCLTQSTCIKTIQQSYQEPKVNVTMFYRFYSSTA